MKRSERNPLFLLYLLLIAGVLAWFLLRGGADDKEQVRINAVAALRDIAVKDAEGLCKKISPQLVKEVQGMDFQALAGISNNNFCVEAAKTVFGLYGDYYVSLDSIGKMAFSDIKIKDGQATVVFNDGEIHNTSTWIKEDGQWKIRSGLKELVEYVSAHDQAKAMLNGLAAGMGAQ